MNSRTINFQIMGDELGNLISLEENRNIPFNIKRVYYIFGTTKGAIRGKHAHPNLQQVVVALKGSCKFLLDDGKSKQNIILNNPAKGLFIGEMIWREMSDFSPDCVLMVLASEYYNEDEYIRDYQGFINRISTYD